MGVKVKISVAKSKGKTGANGTAESIKKSIDLCGSLDSRIKRLSERMKLAKPVLLGALEVGVPEDEGCKVDGHKYRAKLSKVADTTLILDKKGVISKLIETLGEDEVYAGVTIPAALLAKLPTADLDKYLTKQKSGSRSLSFEKIA